MRKVEAKRKEREAGTQSKDFDDTKERAGIIKNTEKSRQP